MNTRKMNRFSYTVAEDVCSFIFAVRVSMLNCIAYEGFNAIEAIFQVIQEQSTPSFDLDGNVISFYNIVRPLTSLPRPIVLRKA